MVVKFPSSSEGDASGGSSGDAQQRLAPVTPLRRSAPGRSAGDDHPSQGKVARPVVGLRSAEPGGGEPQVGRPSESTQRDSAVSDGGWNNTWGGGPSSRAAEPAAEEDEETARQTRKTSGVAIRQLARRGMSRWELEQVLIRREIPPEVYGPELDRLETLGVIDDASLATTLAFTQHSRKGLGRSAIEQELKRRHIDPELIGLALADIGQDDELERAIELAMKRIGQLEGYDDETARRRLHAFLARKGYASEVVRQAMEAAFTGRRSRGGSGVRFQ